MKVLLADDSRTTRMLERHGLERCGADVIVEAVDGTEALMLFEFALLSDDSFDLVLTDWNMPGLDGLQLLRAIRRLDRDVPVILVTTESERSRIVAAIRAGVTDYLVKPFGTEALASKIRTHTGVGV